VATNWPINTHLIVRRVVNIPHGAENVRIVLSVDNDVRGVFFDGARIGGPIRREGCTPGDRYEFQFDVPQPVQPGEHLVAFHLLDRGLESFFDAQILADVPPDQVSDAVIVQQTAPVPVSDVDIAFSVGADSSRSVTIPYVVTETGESSEIRIEQREQELTVQTLLGGELAAFAKVNPDVTTMTRSLNATERLSRFDPGILSPPSVFTNPNVLEGIFRSIAAVNGSSCEEACNRKATLSSLALSLGVRSRIGGFRTLEEPFVAGASLLSAASEGTALKKIEAARKQCVSGCMQPDPVPPPCMPGDPPPCPQLPTPPPSEQCFQQVLQGQPCPVSGCQFRPYAGNTSFVFKGTLRSFTNPSTIFGNITIGLVKRGFSTAQCGNPSAIIALQPTQKTTEIASLYGTSQQQLPVTIVACVTANASQNVPIDVCFLPAK
jgi:hypothetical protein